MNPRNARIRGVFGPSGFRGPAVGLLSRGPLNRTVLTAGETYADVIGVTSVRSPPPLRAAISRGNGPRLPGPAYSIGGPERATS